MNERLIPNSRLRLAVAALLFASMVCVTMIVGRALFSGKLFMSGLVWNLFLAWIPLGLSVKVYALYARRPAKYGLLIFCAVSWFFFFPNAPYIVTDFVHFKTRAPVPRWFDILMFTSFAWTGLFVGYLSLYLMQEVIRSWKGRHWSWRFAIAMLALSSLGVYLGRFQRWNSWDVIARPLGIAADVVKRADFLTHPQMLAFCATFFVFSLLAYFTLFAFTHLHGWVPRDRESSDSRV